tara:strand:- start:521 stop:739 length:219 start_codon:yes stop_codon:yes gene_type:complete|eukprot:scaffold9182_cov31-Phaeocystis_antarctica.AAC.1
MAAHSMAELRQEIAVQKMLDHPNIVKVFETFEDTVTDRHSNLALIDIITHLQRRSADPVCAPGPVRPTGSCT